jgi:ADP-ribose pyrophosphatase YjhB (NUDIX family)
MDILKLFQYNQKLRFSDIEKALNERSNKLAYHLKNLTKKGILVKQGKEYSLSENAEKLLPYISEKDPILTVVLVLIGNKNKCFLHLREKRPFKNKLSMPGGRMLVGESVKQAAERIAKKFNAECRFKKILSVSLEHVKKNNRIIHSFFLVFVEAKAKNKVNLTDMEINRKKVIPSDYRLITRKPKGIKIETFFTPA